MREFLSILFKVTRDEFISLYQNNKRNLIVMVATPLFFISLLGYLYSSHVVMDIRTVVFDQDNSSLSRSVRDQFGNSEKFQLIGQVDSEAELKNSLESGTADAALVIPANFQKDIKKLHASEVLIIVNGSNMMISNSVVSAASEIVQTVSAGVGIKVLGSKGFLPGSAQKLASEISFRTRVWYNPTYNYANFLLLGLLGTVIQQIMLLYTAIAIVDSPNSVQEAVTEHSFSNFTAFIFGKFTPYFIINLVNTNVCLAITFWGFQVPMNGSWLTLIILEIVFIACIAALGIFLSTICPDQLQATQLAMLVAVPSFLLSGYTWPLQSMPYALQLVSQALPLSYFVNALRKVALMGVGLQVIGRDILFLAVGALILIPLSILTLRQLHIRKLALVCQRGTPAFHGTIVD